MINILLPNRTDFLGSNFVAKLSVFMNSTFSNNKLYHDRNMLYYDSMFIKPFIKTTDEKDKCLDKIIEYDERTQDANIRVLQGKTVENINQDLISYFKDNYKKDFFEIISTIAKERNYKLPWNDNNKIICIHLRLYDDHWHEGAVHNDYNGTGSSNYIKELIENNNIKSFNKKYIAEYCKINKHYDALTGEHPDRQVAIDINKLENIINELRVKYPEKEIHIITKLTNNINNKKYVDLCYKYNIPIHSSDDYDYDLWLLINSEVLVLSKSTYSLVSGYFHQGSTVLYPLWGIFASTGLYTKYDKSGWNHYI
jgi:hypothetical protein